MWPLAGVGRFPAKIRRGSLPAARGKGWGSVRETRATIWCAWLRLGEAGGWSPAVAIVEAAVAAVHSGAPVRWESEVGPGSFKGARGSGSGG
jgi:hypothetical protein